jgi:Prokaryotic E2 family D
MSLHTRKFMRIEGDLATLVTEVTEHEVALSDLVAKLVEEQPADSAMLPSGCRYWVRAPDGRQVFVVEQLPMRRSIDYRDRDDDLTSHWLGLPFVVFVVSAHAVFIDNLQTYFRTGPLASLDDALDYSCLPNTYEDGTVCLGSMRVSGNSLAERVDSLIAAYWSSEFNAEVEDHVLPVGEDFWSWAERSESSPAAGLSLTYERCPRTLREVVAHACGVVPDDLAGHQPGGLQTAVDTPLPDTPRAPERGEADAIAA